MALGTLEVEVLRAVRSLGAAKVGDIHARVKERHAVAYSTVTTVVYRLVDKGLLAPDGTGAHSKRFAIRAEGLRVEEGTAARDLVDVFGPEAVVRLLDAVKAKRGQESDEVRRRLRRLGAK